MLPLLELLVWSTLVPIPTLLLCGRIYLLQRHANASREPRRFETVVPRNRWLEFSLQVVGEQNFDSVMDLNLPGVLIWGPMSVPANSYLEKHAAAISPRVLQVVTLPFCCLPAWWFVGVGVEGLLARKRLHLAMRLIGSVLCSACIAFAVGILFAPPGDRGDMLPFIPGAVLWTGAFGLFPLGWWLRRRGKVKT